jgi:hypothetical protein
MAKHQLFALDRFWQQIARPCSSCGKKSAVIVVEGNKRPIPFCAACEEYFSLARMRENYKLEYERIGREIEEGLARTDRMRETGQ